MSRMDRFFERFGEDLTYKNRTQTSPGDPVAGEEPDYNTSDETVKILRARGSGPTQQQAPRSYQDSETITIRTLTDLEENAQAVYRGERFVLRNKREIEHLKETVYEYELVREVDT